MEKGKDKKKTLTISTSFSKGPSSLPRSRGEKKAFVIEKKKSFKPSFKTQKSWPSQKLSKGKPVVILMKTEMGNGVDFMMNTHAWHGVAPTDEQLKSGLKQTPETLGDY